ncbi:unnamed protein product [Moneuplotes crassus]|uniref:AAA+ ATPase domain-containing protein n=1 Tax=Euplotes crassus TaxID=5936 RepID=A0AAD1XQG3_EUPCR|nr:unnamed protein product [Moneuplotes crassus]
MEKEPDDEENKEVIDHWRISEKLQSDEKCSHKFIIGNHKAKQYLCEGIMLPFRYPQFFVSLRSPTKSYLLFGPKGSGKEFIIDMIAQDSNAKVETIDFSDIKWEETRIENNKILIEVIDNIFNDSCKENQKIIWLKNIDNLKPGADYYSRALMTTLLLNFSNISLKNSLAVIATSEAPWGINPSIRRRLDKRIYCKLPGRQDRLEMLQSNILGFESLFTEEEISQICELTEGFGFSDLDGLIESIIKYPLSHLTQDPMIFEVAIEQLDIPKISLDEVQKYIEAVTPPTFDDSKFEKWREDFTDF